jgi:hypothetical protein
MRVQLLNFNTDIGIVWAQGKQIKQYGMANFD